jgi:hypothetical protein
MLGLLVLGVLALSVAAVLSVTLGPHDLAGTAQAQGGPSLALDVNIDNGSGPCDPIDATRSVNVGDTFQVAVCLTNSSFPPAAFQFDLLYDGTFNQCVPSDCAGTFCLDSNPDANAGATTWGGTSLGDGWDCDVAGVTPPTCNKSAARAGNSASGDASLQCLSAMPPALKVGEGVSASIAVVTFKSIATGTDTFDFSQVEVDRASGGVMVDCESLGSCAGGSVAIAAVSAPTATIASAATAGEPTAAAATAAAAGASTAAAVATAVAQGTPMAAINQAATATSAAATKTAAGATSTPGSKATAKPTAAAGEGGGSSGPNAAVIAAIVVVSVVAVGGVGWFAWRRLRAG